MKVEDFHAQQLEKNRLTWEAGVYPALFQTVDYCARMHLPLPEWASVELLNILLERFHDDSVAGSNGAYGGLKGRLRMDYCHYLRWNALRWTMALNFVAALPERRGRKKAGVVSKRELLAEAAKRLEGNPMARAGDGRQIEESYRLVEASRQAGEKRFAFDDLYFPLS
jgi:hypothetical protein